MKKILGASVVAGAILFTGCGPKEINVSDYPNSINTPVVVPDVCKSQYDALRNIPRVAVLPFTNNSNLSKANVANANASASYQGGAALVGGPGAAAVGVSEKAHVSVNKVKRVVDPKLDKAITSQLEAMLAQMGGAKVYSRADLKKVLQEQKLQQSGLIDEKTAVKVGKLAGVRYIVTGSIDGVTIEHKDYRQAGRMAASLATNNNQQQDLGSQLLGAAIQLGASAASGWKVTTTGTIKVIDTETGKVVFSKNFEESKNLGMVDKPQLTYDEKIGGVKDDLKEAIEDAKEDLSKFFALKGYIMQVKTDKDHKNYIALINLGQKDKVQPGQEFDVISFEKVVDPITHKASCSMNTMAVTLTVAKNQVQADKSWTYADGEDAPKLRPGQIVKRRPLKNSALSF